MLKDVVFHLIDLLLTSKKETTDIYNNTESQWKILKKKNKVFWELHL